MQNSSHQFTFTRPAEKSSQHLTKQFYQSLKFFYFNFMFFSKCTLITVIIFKKEKKIKGWKKSEKIHVILLPKLLRTYSYVFVSVYCRQSGQFPKELMSTVGSTRHVKVRCTIDTDYGKIVCNVFAVFGYFWGQYYEACNFGLATQIVTSTLCSPP